jgi:hypothetical protein
MPEIDQDNKKLTLSYATDNRKSEIALLWTRALYFWGLIGALLVMYGVTLQYGHRTIALSAACLGFLCSFSWTLANRSSKYWQEVWEKKVEAAGGNVEMENIFPRSSNPEIQERWFWGAKQFSPSKLAIAVSDLIVVGWVTLGMAAVIPRLFQLDSHFGKIAVVVANLGVIIFTAAYAFAIFFWCRSGQPLKWSEVRSVIIQKWTKAKSIVRRWSQISN